MKLSSILDSNLVLCHVKGENRQEIYKTMISEASKHVSWPLSVDDLTNAIIERENAVRIPWEKGVALPHLRHPEFSDLHIVVGILEHEIKLKDCDLAPASVIIMSFISEKTSDTYLKAVSAFSRYLLHSENLEKVACCVDASTFLTTLDSDDVRLKKDITAEDIMNEDFSFISDKTMISEVLDLFIRDGKNELPILDEGGKFKGVVSGASIISRNIPEYIMMMDNLKFIKSLEPFEKLLKRKEELLAHDFTQEAKEIISPQTPLIQLTVSLVKGHAENLYVVDENGILKGIVTIQELISKLLRA